MGYKLLSFDKIPSTQTLAQEMVANWRATDKTVIVAKSQSAGRGRHRRQWISHTGNLYASFIYAIDERDPKLSYAVAVAIAETLISFEIMPQIKWPNDILIDGKKVSGTLIEYAKSFVIIGIGINIKSNPTVEKYETTKLGNWTSATVDDVLAELMKNLDVWIRRDFEIVRARWTDLAAGLNAMITYKNRRMEMIGINENGALVLRNGTQYIMTYGDEVSI